MTLDSRSLSTFDGIEEVVEGVVEGAEVGVDLLLEGAGEEAEAFAGFDGGADEDDAGDLFRDEGADGHGDGEVGLAGTGGTEAEGHVAGFDGLDVLALVGAARLNHALDAGGSLLSGVDEGFEGDRGVCDEEFEQAVELSVMEIDTGFAQGFKVQEELRYAADGGRVAGDVYAVGAEIDIDVEAVFQETEVFVVGSVEGLNTGGDGDNFGRLINQW